MLDILKHGHIKSRLDECKKFDEECKYRAIAGKVYRDMICQAMQIPIEIFNRKYEVQRFKNMTDENLGIPWTVTALQAKQHQEKLWNEYIDSWARQRNI